MASKLKQERGMSLVEATIILMVLAVLSAVMAPAVGDFLSDAKQTKATEDVQAIGMAIERVVRDVGFSCLSKTPGSPTDTPRTACTKANRVDLLVSNGNDPKVSAANHAIEAGAATDTTGNWLGAANTIGAGNRDTMDNQFVTNGPGYTNASYTLGAGPRPGIGWRGAYLTGPLGPDPWGFKYQSNTIFLTVAQDATAGTTEGLQQGGWKSDVIVVSGGANGVIDTVFSSVDTSGASGTIATADDIIYVARGSTR